VTTLKEFEEALRERGMDAALAILEGLRERDKARRAVAPARRITGRKMTPELARNILKLHQTTKMTQQEIAFKLGVNQGRVNEVIKRGKWLSGDPNAPEAIARDKALERAARAAGRRARRASGEDGPARRSREGGAGRKARQSPADQAQLLLGDF
jgi:hypothetical protein